MKKTAVLLTAALVLSLAAPSVLAAQGDVTGQVETRFEYKKDDSGEYRLNGLTGIKLSPSLAAGDKVRLGIQFETQPDEFDDEDNPTRDFAADHGSMSTTLSRVWLETKGALWHGGPEVTTTIGDKELNWNAWVAHMNTRRGIAVEGLDLGVAKADVFYVWPKDDEDGRPMGIRVGSGILEGVDLSAMAVRRADKFNAAVSAATELHGVRLDGTLALDSARRYAFKVNAAMDAAENLTLKAGFRQMQAGFAPMYPELDEETGYIAPFHPDSDASGFSIGVETVQQGVTLTAEYDQPTNKAVLSAAKTFDVHGHAIEGKYTATIKAGEDVKHELEASTVTNLIPYLQGLGLSGELAVQGSNVEYEVGATYEAPNGMYLGAKYNSDSGAVVSGGLKVSF